MLTASSRRQQCHSWQLVLALLVLVVAAGERAAGELPFRDPTLPLDARVRDLVSRLTAEELVQQLSRGGAGPNGGPAPGIERLGISPNSWNTECLRGDGLAGPATSFPQALNLAAAGSDTLHSLVAFATALEVRAKFNNYSAARVYGDHRGINCFAPVGNLLRHPFWGRAQETYGEDPLMAAQLSAAYVAGLQGDSPTARRLLLPSASAGIGRYLPASATCKHFAAYNGPENFPQPRETFNAEVPEQDLRQTFLPALRSCLGAGALGVMCSYNAVNGVPACANRRLLTDILRREWKFPGFVVSDEGALEFLVDHWRYFANKTAAAVGAFRAGVDLELSLPACRTRDCVVFQHLAEALAAGAVTRCQLELSARRLFAARFRLGEFDPREWNPYSALLPPAFVQSPTHRSLSEEAAASGLVLLKRVADFLPLRLAAWRSVGLVGPFADNMSLVYGDYSAERMPSFETSLPDGLRAAGARVSVSRFCLDGVQCRRRNATALRRLVEDNDLLVVAVGTGPELEGENLDRRSLSLPAGQEMLVRSLLAAGRPLILLIFSGGPVLVDFAEASDSVKAALWCGYPAQAAGAAVASVLTGRFAPFAVLPFTWYSSSQRLDSITDYRMTSLTYRFASSEPLYWFGHGLTLPQCEVSLAQLRVSGDGSSGLVAEFDASLSARSGVACLYSARAYLRPLFPAGRNPRVWMVARQLVAWQPNDSELSRSVRLWAPAEQLRLWDHKSASLRLLPGNYSLVVGRYFDSACRSCRLQRNVTLS